MLHFPAISLKHKLKENLAYLSLFHILFLYNLDLLINYCIKLFSKSYIPLIFQFHLFYMK